MIYESLKNREDPKNNSICLNSEFASRWFAFVVNTKNDEQKEIKYSPWCVLKARKNEERNDVLRRIDINGKTYTNEITFHEHFHSSYLWHVCLVPAECLSLSRCFFGSSDNDTPMLSSNFEAQSTL